MVRKAGESRVSALEQQLRDAAMDGDAAEVARLLDAFPEGIELDVPAFCVFDDMEEFRPLREIG